MCIVTINNIIQLSINQNKKLSQDFYEFYTMAHKRIKYRQWLDFSTQD